MDTAATTGEAPEPGVGTPDARLSMGTTVVGGPVADSSDPAEPGIDTEPYELGND